MNQPESFGKWLGGPAPFCFEEGTELFTYRLRGDHLPTRKWEHPHKKKTDHGNCRNVEVIGLERSSFHVGQKRRIKWTWSMESMECTMSYNELSVFRCGRSSVGCLLSFVNKRYIKERKQTKKKQADSNNKKWCSNISLHQPWLNSSVTKLNLPSVGSGPNGHHIPFREAPCRSRFFQTSVFRRGFLAGSFFKHHWEARAFFWRAFFVGGSIFVCSFLVV